MSRKSIFMENTQVAPSKTAAEIVQRLVESGAQQISIDYVEQEPVALCFTVAVNGRAFSYRLPARVEPVFRYLQGKRQDPYGYEDRDQAKAKRVAWRQLLRWVEAQMAMIATGMASADEVFMPYTLDAQGQTMYEAWRGRLLEAPKEAAS